MSRPDETEKESIMSVAQAVLWALETYGFPRSSTPANARPNSTRRETIMSVGSTVEWAWT